MPVELFPVQEYQSEPDFLCTYQDEGQGTALLLIHGSLCDLRYWRWQIPTLRKEVRVVVPSLRHFWPHSEVTGGPFSIEQHCDDIYHLIKKLNLKKVHLLGHSRGALVALKFALKHPEYTASLILADPALRSEQEQNNRLIQEQAWGKIRSGHIDEGLEFFIDQVTGKGSWKKMVSWFKEMVRDNAVTLALQCQEPVCIFTHTQLMNLDLPITIMGGSESPDPFPHIIARLKRIWPQARSYTLTPASHGMNLALPNEFNQIILNHLTTFA